MTIKTHDLEAWTQLLMGLLPTGRAWPRRRDSNLYKLMEVFAESFVLLEERQAALYEESDPRTIQELLGEMEAEHGLPDTCSEVLASSVERKLYLLVKIQNNPGTLSIPYFERLAAALGYEGITITETGTFEWTVDGTKFQEHWSRCGSSRCGDRIVERQDDFLFCLFRRLRPAHTRLVFTSQSIYMLEPATVVLSAPAPSISA